MSTRRDFTSVNWSTLFRCLGRLRPSTSSGLQSAHSAQLEFDKNPLLVRLLKDFDKKVYQER